MVPASGLQIATHRGSQQKPERAAKRERRRRGADLWAATGTASPRGIGVQRRFRDRAAGGPGVAMSDGGEEGLASWPSRRCRRTKRGIQVRRRRDSLSKRLSGVVTAIPMSPLARGAREVVDRGFNESSLSEKTRDATEAAGVGPRWRAFTRARRRRRARARTRTRVRDCLPACRRFSVRHGDHGVDAAAQTVIELDLHETGSAAGDEVVEHPVGRVLLIDAHIAKARQIVLE